MTKATDKPMISACKSGSNFASEPPSAHTSADQFCGVSHAEGNETGSHARGSREAGARGDEADALHAADAARGNAEKKDDEEKINGPQIRVVITQRMIDAAAHEAMESGILDDSLPNPLIWRGILKKALAQLEYEIASDPPTAD